MKKIVYCAAALATMIFAGSCQQENLEPVAQENTVTYTVELPDVQTKAIGDAATVDELIYEVWKTETANVRNLTDPAAKATRLYQDRTALVQRNGKTCAVVTFNLVQDQEYTILFWAQKAGTDVYDTDELTDVHYKSGCEPGSSNYSSNQENYAAFYAAEFVSDVDSKSRNVTLKRPFAQLNIATKNTVKDYTVAMNTSKVTISNVATHFDVAMNLPTETAVSVPASFEFKTADVPTDPAQITVNGQVYDYVAMNYVFAMGPNVTVDYEINTTLTAKNLDGTDGTTTTAQIKHTVPNVPLKENYRTNIVGNLLSSTTEYEVIVDARWAGDDLEPDPLYLAASLGGEITLEHDHELTIPLIVTRDLKINLNGFRIKGGKDYVDNAGLTAADISAITIEDDAILTIYGKGSVEGGEYAVTVRNGTFNGLGGDYIGNTTGIYIVDGTANLSGGSYAVREPDKNSGRYYVVNCNDSYWNKGLSKVNITGGTYTNFNPNKAWESLHNVNFLAEGYTVIPNTTDAGTEYTVVSGATVTTTDEFKEAAQNASLEYIIIDSDLDFSGETVTIATDKIILGNEHNFNAGGGNAYAINVVQGAEVRLEKLVMIDGGGIKMFNGANVTVNNVTIKPKYNNSSRHIFYIDNSNLTVESGSFEVVRTGSRYIAAVGNSNILIKGGIWGSMVNSGYAPVLLNATSALSITGGSFKVTPTNYKFDPTAYLANGYTTVSEGNYMVVVAVSE